MIDEKKVLACLYKRRYLYHWSHRLELEKLGSLVSVFVTLTISPDYYDDFTYNDLIKYIKRCRKECSLRYIFMNEYGGKFDRLHFHGIVFSQSPDVVKVLKKQWKYGFTKFEFADMSKIRYICKYIFKDLDNGQSEHEKPFPKVNIKSNGIGCAGIDRYLANGGPLVNPINISGNKYFLCAYLRNRYGFPKVDIDVAGIQQIWKIVNSHNVDYQRKLSKGGVIQTHTNDWFLLRLQNLERNFDEYKKFNDGRKLYTYKV